MNALRFVIITDALRAFGFRLAGVEAISVEGAQGAQEQLAKLMRRGDVGIVGMNENYMSELDPAIRRRLDQTNVPLLIAIPPGNIETARELQARRVAESIRRIIGWRINLGG